MYEKARDAKRLAEVLQVQLEHTKDPAERQERMLRVAQILESDAGDKPLALKVALRALSENPREEWAREYAERLAGDTSNWALLVEVYEAVLPSLRGPEALPFLATVARAYEKELANTEAAIARNRRILEIVDRDEQAVLALERLYIATGQHDQLLAIYDKKLALAGSEEEKREVRLQLAALYEEQVHDADKAIELYKAILRTSKEDAQALRALDRLYRGTGNWKELARIIARELKLPNDDPSTAELKFRLGEVSEKYLNSPGVAVGAYQEALALDATHAGARAALEVYLENDRYQTSAVGALEPIYEAGHEVERLLQVQRIKLAREKDAAARVALLLRIGALEGEAGRAQQAYQAYAEAFSISPESAEARAALEALADREVAGVGGPLQRGSDGSQASARVGARDPVGHCGGLRREAQPIGQGGRVLPPGTGDRAGRCLRTRGAGTTVHADRALVRSGRYPEEEGGVGPFQRRARADSRPHCYHLGRGYRKSRRGHCGVEGGAGRQLG
jgi:tetratricopeptide (TPR) repeat protein